MLFFFFCQAEDGIRHGTVTGVQTCALPIFPDRDRAGAWLAVTRPFDRAQIPVRRDRELIGPSPRNCRCAVIRWYRPRASCKRRANDKENETMMNAGGFALLFAGALAGGFVSGLAGFGTALMTLGIWLYLMPPALAVPLVLICSVVGQS